MKHLFLVLALLLSSACTSIIHVDRRTPMIPVFPEVVHDDHSKTNPWFNKLTTHFERQEMKLDDGTRYRTFTPTLVSPIGTYYRFPTQTYVYMMTAGAGLQQDLFYFGKTKVMTGLMFGYYRNNGIQLAISHQIYKWWRIPFVPYVSIQRRQVRNFIQCTGNPSDYCNNEKTQGKNSIRAREDVMTSILGIQIGRFLVHDQSRMTVYLKLEYGYNDILSKKLTHEAFPSDYRHSDGPFIGTELGVTFW